MGDINYVVGRITVVNDKVNDETLVAFFKKHTTEVVLGFDDADEEVSRPHYHFCCKITKATASFRIALTRQFEVKGEDYSLTTRQYDGKGMGYAVKNRLVFSNTSSTITQWVSGADYKKTKKTKPENVYEAFIQYARDAKLQELNYTTLAKCLLEFKKGAVSIHQGSVYVSSAMFALSPETRCEVMTDFASRINRSLSAYQN